jgi:hypothetical protein
VSGSLIDGGEDAGGFDDVFGSSRSPLYLGGVSVVEDGDGLGHVLDDKHEKFGVTFPLMTSLPSWAETSPLKTPWVESYLNM